MSPPIAEDAIGQDPSYPSSAPELGTVPADLIGAFRLIF